MVKKHSFSAVIKAEGNGTFVEVPFDAEQEFGKSRVPIVAEFEGISYQGTLVRMKSECHLLLVRKEIREKLNKQAGDTISIIIWEDKKTREVEIPADVKKLLEQYPSAADFFAGLSYTHRREYIEWITGAKKTETRERRKAKMIDMLLNGKKEPR